MPKLLTALGRILNIKMIKYYEKRSLLNFVCPIANGFHALGRNWVYK